MKIKKQYIVFLLPVLILLGFYYGYNNKESIIIKKSKEIDLSKNTGTSGIVSITGKLRTSDTIKDDYLTTDKTYIKLIRKTEMYSWYTEKIGGRKIYKRGWQEEPMKSSESINKVFHNPSKKIESKEYTANKMLIDNYEIVGEDIRFANIKPVTITNLCMLPEGSGTDGEFIFIKENSIINPKLGDIRIKYFGISEHENVTVFGKINNNKIIPIKKYGENHLRVYAGNREQAIEYFEEL